MAFTIATAHTLPEALRHKAPDGSYMWAYDALAKNKYPMIEEMYWEQANDDLAHEFLRNVSKPTGTLVQLEEGAPFEISVDRAVREQICRIEGNMRMDVRALEKASHPSQYYREKQERYLQGLVRTVHETIFAKGGRGNMVANPKDINGLGTRYNNTAMANVETMATSGSNLSSAWLIKHGPEGMFGIFPKTASRSIQVNELGEQVVYDANNNPFRAVMTNFAWEFGMGIMDDACVQRLAGIAPTGNTSFFGGDASNIYNGERALIDLIEKLPGGNTDQAAIYVGPQLMGQFRKRLNEKGQMFFTMETVWGRPMLHFMEIPIIRVDTLSALETITSTVITNT
jgi:hypothetical protein